MLSDKEVMATIAVRDLAAARRFYEDKLGFELEHIPSRLTREGIPARPRV